MSTEREDFLALQTDPGWLRLLQYAKSLWGVKAYALRLEKAQSKEEIQALKMAHGLLDDFVNYPTTRVSALDKQAEAEQVLPSMSRRGSL